MIEIAAAVCMLGAPERCKDITLSFEEAAITPYTCIMYGQSELAKWTGEHPDWRISKWQCRRAGQVAKL